MVEEKENEPVKKKRGRPPKIKEATPIPKEIVKPQIKNSFRADVPIGKQIWDWLGIK